MGLASRCECCPRNSIDSIRFCVAHEDVPSERILEGLERGGDRHKGKGAAAVRAEDLEAVMSVLV